MWCQARWCVRVNLLFSSRQPPARTRCAHNQGICPQAPAVWGCHRCHRCHRPSVQDISFLTPPPPATSHTGEQLKTFTLRKSKRKTISPNTNLLLYSFLLMQFFLFMNVKVLGLIIEDWYLHIAYTLWHNLCSRQASRVLWVLVSDFQKRDTAAMPLKTLSENFWEFSENKLLACTRCISQFVEPTKKVFSGKRETEVCSPI